MTTIELVIGQQATAALTVSDAIPDYYTALQTLGDDVQTLCAGFTGGAAAGMAEALTAWFEVAATLGPALEKYAQALVVVDKEHAKNEDVVVRDYSHLYGRLGGIR